MAADISAGSDGGVLAAAVLQRSGFTVIVKFAGHRDLALKA